MHVWAVRGKQEKEEVVKTKKGVNIKMNHDKTNSIASLMDF